MKLTFYDVKTKKKFDSETFEIREKESKGVTRFFAVTKAPGADHECWRILSKDLAAQLRKEQ